MKKVLFATMIMIVLATGLAFGGQCTGGDKNKLNPQPLPPGRHHQYRRGHHHKHRHSTASGSCSSCQRSGGSRGSTNKPK